MVGGDSDRTKCIMYVIVAMIHLYYNKHGWQFSCFVILLTIINSIFILFNFKAFIRSSTISKYLVRINHQQRGH